MNAPDRMANRLVDCLADRVPVPSPPSDLSAKSGRRSSIRRIAVLGILAGAVIGGALVLESTRLRTPDPVTTRAAAPQATREVAARVVVDHLRIHRREVRPHVAEVPRADAIVVSALQREAALGRSGLDFFPEAWAGEGDAAADEPVSAERLYESATPSYHVRFLRARMNSDTAGSVLFRTHEFVIPLTERESWGHADQAAALREALGATEIESLPGLVVRSGNADDGGPYRFETAMGENLVALTFVAEPMEGGWHRVRISAAGPGLPDGDLLDIELRVADGATVAVAAPLDDGGDTLVISVTPLDVALPQDFGQVSEIDGTSVTPPSLREKHSPVYPQKAIDERFTGKVVMEVVVRRDGTPDRLVVIAMPEGGEWLAGSAADAVSRWRWDPAMRDGKPIDVYMTLVIEFRLK